MIDKTLYAVSIVSRQAVGSLSRVYSLFVTQSSKVNIVLNVHRNHEAYWGRDHKAYQSSPGDSVYKLGSSGVYKPRVCVKFEVAVLGSPSLISLVVSVDVK